MTYLLASGKDDTSENIAESGAIDAVSNQKVILVISQICVFTSSSDQL